MFEDEPFLVSRIKKAREKAQKIVNGDIDTTEDFIYGVRLYLSKIYGIPVFSEYFENLEIDKLVFEAELHRAQAQTNVDKASEAIKDNKEELAEGLFGDWEKQDMNEIIGNDPEWEEMSKKFMETGEFINTEKK